MKCYDAIKEGGSTRILGHLMRVPASSYFFALLHFLRKVSIIILLLLITKLLSPLFTTLNFLNKLSHPFLRLSLQLARTMLKIISRKITPKLRRNFESIL